MCNLFVIARFSPKFVGHNFIDALVQLLCANISLCVVIRQL